jgi:hypothetical protein
MSCNKFHSNLDGADIHTIQRWCHLNEAARLSESVTESDIGKVSKQVSGQSYYILFDNDPLIWLPLAISGTEAHATTHISGGSDEIDGDRLDIDLTPSKYTPDTTVSGLSSSEFLGAHLAGIDNALSGICSTLEHVVRHSGISTDNAIARWDGTTGEYIQNSTATLDDSGNLDTNGGSIDTSGTGAVLGSINGIKYYGKATSDPTAPAPEDGDTYYNTDLAMEMKYDETRGKWLSVESQVVQFGRNNNIAAGAFFRGINGLPFTATIGYPAFYSGTVVAFGYTRADVDAATFELTRDGGTFYSLASSATTDKDITANEDFPPDVILGARNASGGNAMTDVAAWFKLKWRSDQ